jgi:hypothetical protein
METIPASPSMRTSLDCGHGDAINKVRSWSIRDA